jgi:lipid II:glycine glycyltransferase (peptidoglycan interpeptide bridge formation enzyme)
MMWEAIKWGKKHNLKVFDLWGREPGKGFTKFKEGYNPRIVEFIGTWDLVIDKPMYYLYKTLDSLRWRVLRIKSKFVTPNF